MFNKFAAALHHAVEALAPQQTLLEDFNFHWKSITHYFINNKDDKKPVQESNIPGHLENMLVLLTQEEAQMEDNQTGPCMEHLLQHKILETLHTLGKADCPPGMKQVVLVFFTNLLGKIRQPLLPHINVYKPVHRLVKVCGSVRAAPTEREEIQFLLLVCAKLRQDPYLVNFFLEVPISKGKSKEAYTLSTSSSGVQPEFSLVDSLLNLVQSPDTRIAVKACEGLMLVASLPEKLAAQLTTEYTQLCTLLAERLCSLYNALPLSMDPVDVDSVEAKWGLDMSSDAEDTNMFPGKRQLISLLSWFDYCDQMTQNAHPLIAKALAIQIRERFLVPILQPLVLQTSEVGIITSTAHLAKFLQMTSSPDLLQEFVFFILGRSTEPEVPGECDHKLRQRLIARCDHLSDEIIIMSLKLFEILLKKPNEHIINNLVLRNLQSRAYVDRAAMPIPETENNVGVSQTDEIHERNEGSAQTLDENNQVIDIITTPNHTEQSDINSDNIRTEHPAEPEQCDILRDSGHETLSNGPQSPGDVDDLLKNIESGDTEHIGGSNEMSSEPSSPMFDLPVSLLHSPVLLTPTPIISSSPPLSSYPATPGSPTPSDLSATPSASSADSVGEDGIGIHKIVNCFLSLMPDASKSSYLTGDVGYDMYLREAHRQFRECSVNCLSCDWPNYATPLDRCSTEGAFFEGALVKMLYDKLTRMLDQTYEVNLQITSVLSKITLFCHPHIHEYFLNPFLPVNPGCRTLHTVLSKVMIDLSMRMKSIPEFQSQVIQVRKQLMGMADEDERNRKAPIMNLPHIDLLEGVIVLEEFCKELAAVAFVKYHAVSGQTPP